MNRVYLDACVVVYLGEASEPFFRQVEARLTPLRLGSGLQLLTSRLSRLECRCKPLREGNNAVLAAYDAFFSASGVALFEVTSAVIERATAIRAQYGVKTPDALHLATAIEEGASVFLTNDTRLLRCTDIKVEVL
jgi:predicted nucleic acid-binding protein